MNINIVKKFVKKLDAIGVKVYLLPPFAGSEPLLLDEHSFETEKPQAAFVSNFVECAFSYTPLNVNYFKMYDAIDSAVSVDKPHFFFDCEKYVICRIFKPKKSCLTLTEFRFDLSNGRLAIDYITLGEECHIGRHTPYNVASLYNEELLMELNGKTPMSYFNLYHDCIAAQYKDAFGTDVCVPYASETQAANHALGIQDAPAATSSGNEIVRKPKPKPCAPQTSRDLEVEDDEEEHFDTFGAGEGEYREYARRTNDECEHPTCEHSVEECEDVVIIAVDTDVAEDDDYEEEECDDDDCLRLCDTEEDDEEEDDEEEDDYNFGSRSRKVVVEDDYDEYDEEEEEDEDEYNRREASRLRQYNTQVQERDKLFKMSTRMYKSSSKPEQVKLTVPFVLKNVERISTNISSHNWGEKGKRIIAAMRILEDVGVVFYKGDGAVNWRCEFNDEDSTDFYDTLLSLDEHPQIDVMYGSLTPRTVFYKVTITEPGYAIQFTFTVTHSTEGYLKGILCSGLIVPKQQLFEEIRTALAPIKQSKEELEKIQKENELKRKIEELESQLKKLTAG